MEIRRLGPADAALAASLVERLLGPPLEEPAMQVWLADRRHVAVGALEDGVPVGLAYGYRLPRPTAQPEGLLLYSIDVAEEGRRRGIATALIAAMRRQAADGMWLLTNESNDAAMGLYAKTGGRRTNPDDVMWWFPPTP